MSDNEINTNHIMNEGVHDNIETEAAEMEEAEKPSQSQGEVPAASSGSHGLELTAAKKLQMEEIEKSQTERDDTIEITRAGHDQHIPVDGEVMLHASERPSQAEAFSGMAVPSGGQDPNMIASEGKGKEKAAEVNVANTTNFASDHYSEGFDTPANTGQTNVLPQAGIQDATAGPSNKIAASHIPLPHSSSSDSASLTTSSISNPALEVDVDVSYFLPHIFLTKNTKAEIGQFDDGFSDADSAITDLRQ